MLNSFKSTSNSNAIRNIENKYNICLSECSHNQLNLLTSKRSKACKITKMSDLMMDMNQFDIDNMTDKERANLKYLVMSTDEVLDILNRKTKTIYYKSRSARLRFLMSYEDFYQICANKLLLNDGILKFDANYKLEPAIHCWIERVAGWKSIKKVNIADEVCILDKPCSADTETTIGEIMLGATDANFNDLDVDVENRINRIMSAMSSNESTKIVFKAGQVVIPFSEKILAELFIIHKLGKKELSKIMINKSTNKPVSNQIFNKFYKQTMLHIANIIGQEYKAINEDFNINIDEF